MCAGNLASDKAIVNRLSTAMQSRLVHFEMELDVEGWLDWASSHGIDYRIKSFINWKKEMLHQFDPDHNDKTFPCGRTWEFCSKLIVNQEVSFNDLPLIAGTIGQGAANDFISYCEVFTKIQTYKEVIANPKGISIADEPSIKHAMVGMIANEATAGDMDKVVDYLERMPIEFQIFALKDIIRRDSSIQNTAPVRSWISKNARELM